jgi:hypothetical protein
MAGREDVAPWSLAAITLESGEVCFAAHREVGYMVLATCDEQSDLAALEQRRVSRVRARLSPCMPTARSAHPTASMMRSPLPREAEVVPSIRDELSGHLIKLSLIHAALSGCGPRWSRG